MIEEDEFLETYTNLLNRNKKTRQMNEISIIHENNDRGGILIDWQKNWRRERPVIVQLPFNLDNAERRGFDLFEPTN